MQILQLDIALATGTIALLLALIIYQIHKIRWLSLHGQQITAKVTSIRHETGKTAWGFPRDNYYLTATWTNPRTGRTYMFWKWIINTRPAYTQGSLIAVLIDPANPKRYEINAEL